MKRTNDVTVGLVPLARTTFDMALAEAVLAQVRALLAGVSLTVTGPDRLVTNLEETEAAAQSLAARPPDLLLVLQASFADSSMILELARRVDAPLLLWAIPEASTGGRLRLNSLCGINLAGHSLTRAGYRYDYIYAAPDDPSVLPRIKASARAGQVRRLLRRTRLGRVGDHPQGFDTCRYDAQALRRQMGVEIIPVALPQLFEQVRGADPVAVAALTQELSQTLPNLAELDQAAVRGTLSSYTTMRQVAEQEQLDGLAVRCWPEFFTELGCAACGAMSMLSDQGIPCSCEADVNGTLTQLILQWLSGEPAFGSDLVSIDAEREAVVLWHCGLAPLSMADPAFTPQGTLHSNRKLPLLMEFPLKPGQVTVARLSEATESYRLVVGRGEMLQAPPSFSGTSGMLRFERPARAVLETIMNEGLEHHLSLTYGDHIPALLALAKMLDLPVLHL